MTSKSSNVTAADDGSFEAEVLRAEGPVLVDFGARWCGPCRAFAPVFEAASKKYPDVVFGKVDVEDQQGLAAAFEVRAIPTLLVVRDGVLLAAQPGAMSAAALDELVKKVKELDMNEVRRSIEEHDREQGTAAPQMGGV